jgi:hypothetical protein
MSVLDTQTVRRTPNRKRGRRTTTETRAPRKDGPTRKSRKAAPRGGDVQPQLSPRQPSDSFRAHAPGRGLGLQVWLEEGMAVVIDLSRRAAGATGWFGALASKVVGGVAIALIWSGATALTLLWRSLRWTMIMGRRLMHRMMPHLRSGVEQSARIGVQGAIQSARVGRHVATATRSGIRDQAEDMRDGFPDLHEGAEAAQRAWLRFLGYAMYQRRELARQGFLDRPGWRQVLHAATVGLVVGGTLVTVSAVALFGPQLARESELLCLNEINVRGNSVVPTSAILETADVNIGDNVTTLDLARIADDLTRLEWVESASLRRSYPDRLALTVVEREPVLMLADEQLWFVDRQGEVFKGVAPDEWTDLPVVTGIDMDSRAVDPDGCRETLRRALDVVEAFGESRSFEQTDIGEFRVEREGLYRVHLVEQQVDLRLAEENYQLGLQRLDTLLSQELIALDQVQSLDLALRNQVVATWKAEL